MNSLDLLSYFPPVRDWSPAQILASPAWAMPCRLGSEEGRLVSDGALLPADPLCLAVRFADDSATLALTDTPLFPELHALWASRTDVPGPILLALVEKECGPLLQLLENAAGRQLAIDGLAEEPAPEADDSSLGTRHSSLREARPFSLLRSSGEALFSFALTLPPSLVEAFGSLRNLDISHPSIRELSLPAILQLAEPTLSTDDLASLAPGDHLLLPEVEASGSRGSDPSVGIPSGSRGSDPSVGIPSGSRGSDPSVDIPSGSRGSDPSVGIPSGSRGSDLSEPLVCPAATLLVDSRLVASASGLAPWTDPGTLRIVLADSSTVTFGSLSDLASGALDHSSLVTRHSSLREGSPLSLLRGPATLASGRLSTVAEQYSFSIESVQTL